MEQGGSEDTEDNNKEDTEGRQKNSINDMNYNIFSVFPVVMF